MARPRVDTRAMQVARVIGMVAGTGEAVTGVAITGIRPMDILVWAITARAMAIHTTGMAITVTATAGIMVRTTTDTTLQLRILAVRELQFRGTRIKSPLV